MKKAELIIAAILVPVDYLMLIAAGLAAYGLRFQTGLGYSYQIPLPEFMSIVALVAGVWLVVFAFSGMYSLRGTRRISEEVRRIFLGCSAGALAVVTLIFFQRELFSSRFIILSAYVLAVVFVMVARLLVLFIQRHLFARGVGAHKVVLVGEGRVARLLDQEFSHNSGLGFHPVARFVRFSEEEWKAVEKLSDMSGVDELIQTDPDLSKDDTRRMMDYCREHHLEFRYAADIFDAQSSRIEIRPIAGVPVIEIKRTPLDGWGKIVKRGVDLLGSIVLILLTSPIMLLAALAILIESGRPVIFLNQRVGQAGRLFDAMKLRSMKKELSIGKQFSNTPQALEFEQQLIQEKSIKEGPVYKIKDDPRVTKLGRCIRATSIDELPQFFNVFMGHMSLVGPRPHQPREVEKYSKRHKEVLAIKPGVTGMAQVSGRSDLDFDDEVRLDTYYIENWSLWFDLWILLKTPFSLFRKRKAL
ncbi:MAG: sugar transferase [Patescibacteria group bacterium]